MAGQIRKYLSGAQEIELVSTGTEGTDLLIVLCGCLRACADYAEFKQQARHCIIVAGESLEGARYNETQIPVALISEIDRLNKSNGD